MEWISVKDKPVPDQKVKRVIIVTNYGNIEICEYDHYSKYWKLCELMIGDHTVTHWMYLPELPNIV